MKIEKPTEYDYIEKGDINFEDHYWLGLSMTIYLSNNKSVTFFKGKIRFNEWKEDLTIAKSEDNKVFYKWRKED